MHRFPIFALLTCASLFLRTEGRADGAPSAACASLTPVHSEFKPQISSPPFKVTLLSSENKVKVRISSPVGEEFQGFVLQARSQKDPSKVVQGKFTKKEGVTRTTDCFNGKENTLTHVGPTLKREVITEWTPARGVNEDVIFRATVLKDYSLFWTGIDSDPITIMSGGSNAPIPSASGNQQDPTSTSMYHNCFAQKGCFGLPAGCVNTQDCEVLLSYTHSGTGISFMLQGYLETLTYMAMGLSFDAQMGDDFVTDCFRRDSSVRSRESWNQGKSNQQTRELSLDRYDGSFKNGLTTCSWTADYLSKAPNGREFDLENNTYYLLLAKGPINEMNEGLGYHSARIASQEAVNFTAFESISGEGISDSVKIHGTFMLTGWLGFVSLGILLARHFKDAFEAKTLGGVKVWFALHRAFMIAALVFISVAFVVIFVHKNGWNYATKNPHAILGCIATAFGLFQPIMAAFRPAADSPKRPVFNWLHFLVGNSAYILAIITIFFAVSLEASGLKQSFYWAISVFVVVHVAFHALFQLHTWNLGRKKNNEMKMLDMSAARSNNMHNNVPEKNLADNVFRILLLGIYSIFLVVILLTFYSLIGVA